MKQGTILIAKNNFYLSPPHGKKILVKQNDIFIVTSPKQNNEEFAIIDRKKSAKLNLGHYLSIQDIHNYFETQINEFCQTR